MKVKIFTSEVASTLENKINDFIEKIEKEHMEVKDIKYSATDSYGKTKKYSALIMYGSNEKVYININGVTDPCRVKPIPATSYEPYSPSDVGVKLL